MIVPYQSQDDWFERATKYEKFTNTFLKHHIKNKQPFFHNKIYKALETEPRLIVVAPTRFGKSVTSSFFKPLVDAIGAHKERILVISATGSLAEYWMNQTKWEFESNQSLREHFGDLRGSKWTSEQIILKSGTSIVAKGLGYQIRGFGYDLIILDDVETKEMARSETQRVNFADWFKSDLLGRAEPGCQIVWIGTFLNNLCYLRKAYFNLVPGFEKWTKLKFEALDENGKSIWEDRWATEELNRQREEMGHRAFSAEKMNNPLPSESQVFQEDWIQYYEKPPVPPLAIAIGLDPNDAKNEYANWGALNCWAKDKEDNYYLLDFKRGHWGMYDSIRALVNMDKRYKSRVAIVESRTTDNPDWKRAIDTEAKDQHTFVPVKFVRPNQDKVSRAFRVTDLFEKRKVFFPSPKIRPDIRTLIDEMLEFPEGEYDDYVDTGTMTLHFLKKQKVVRPKRGESQNYFPQKADAVSGRMK